MFGSSWKANKTLRRVSKSEENINDILPSNHLESIELFWSISTGASNFEKEQRKGKKKTLSFQGICQFEERFNQVLACLYLEKLSKRSGWDKGFWKAGSVVTLTSYANKYQQ